MTQQTIDQQQVADLFNGVTKACGKAGTGKRKQIQVPAAAVAGAGPMATAVSQSSTCIASESASEKTATVRIPSDLAVRATRRAISPRFAMSSVFIMPRDYQQPSRRASVSINHAFCAFDHEHDIDGSCLTHGCPD